MKNTLKYFLGVFLLFSVCAWSKASDILIVVDDEMIKDNEIRDAINTYTRAFGVLQNPVVSTHARCTWAFTTT